MKFRVNSCKKYILFFSLESLVRCSYSCLHRYTIFTIKENRQNILVDDNSTSTTDERRNQTQSKGTVRHLFLPCQTGTVFTWIYSIYLFFIKQFRWETSIPLVTVVTRTNRPRPRSIYVLRVNCFWSSLINMRDVGDGHVAWHFPIIIYELLIYRTILMWPTYRCDFIFVACVCLSLDFIWKSIQETGNERKDEASTKADGILENRWNDKYLASTFCCDNENPLEYVAMCPSRATYIQQVPRGVSHIIGYSPKAK